MSNVKLQASASGTGTVTIAPPVTNSDLTINLPANSGTVPTIASVVNNGVVYTNSTGAITSSSALTFDGTNLGVGTSTPAYAIHAAGNVNGNVTVASNNTSAGTSAFSRFLALADAGNAQFGMTSSAYTDITGATDALLLNANNASGGMAFALDGVLRMKLDSSGNLGLGVTPSAWSSAFKGAQIGLGAFFGAQTNVYATHVMSNAVFDSVSYKYIASTNATTYRQYLGAHEWFTAPSGTAGNTISFTQAMTLTAGGDLGIGVTSPAARLDLITSSQIISQLYSSNANGGYMTLGRSAAPAIIGSYSAASGGGSALNADALYFRNANGIGFGLSGNVGMTFDTSGNLLVGTTSSAGRITVLADSGNNVAAFRSAGAVSATRFARFDVNTSTEVGSIQYNGTGTSYVTTSDYRLKENIAPMTGALAKVALLKPCSYTWKSNGERDEGFIAHELAEVCPRAVSGEKDAVNEDGSIKPQGIDTSFLVATLTAAIQELKAELDSVKAELNALKGT